jgi:hypothetical protein
MTTIAEVKQIAIKCPLCGLEVQRFYSAETGTTEIPAIDYVNSCKLAPERPAFDFHCSKLQEAIDAAIRQEKEDRQR